MALNAWMNRARPAAALVAALCLAAGTPGCNWKAAVIEAAAGIALGVEHGTLFYTFDTLAHPGEKADLVARVQYAKKMKPVEDVAVEFRLGSALLGRIPTDEEGYARLAWAAPGAGDHDVAVKIVAVPDEDYEEMLKVSPASLLVSVRPRDTRFVVIDLDHTVVASSFVHVLADDAKPMDRAAESVNTIAKTYSVIYLTHRPDLLASKSKRWLSEHKFPRAPLLVSSLSEAFGDSGEFKTGRIKALREQFAGVGVGIGDKFSDAEAYVANGMTAYLIPHYDRDEDDPKDVRKLAKKIRDLDPRIQVVDTWRQVLAGLFNGQAFPAAAYAARLEARADALQQERDRTKARKRREEDDDDDDDD